MIVTWLQGKILAESGLYSSRGEFVGSGPNAGVYQSRPIPADQEDLPVFLNDELLSLGGKLNNVIEGGVFPPQSELPKRFKEGMTIFFTQPVKDTEITSSGVWLYKDSKWWKMINDPSALTQTLSAYTVTAKGSATPNKPPRDKYLPADLGIWGYTPSTNSDTTTQWISVAALAHIGEDPKVEWSDPLIFNSQGDVGPPGEEGFSVTQKFIAATYQPKIADVFAKDPEDEDGNKFTSEMPQVSHPDHDYVWVTMATLKGTEIINSGWSEPSRYSTPDTTKAAMAYASSKEKQYPPFNASASGLPGPDWTPTEPILLDGYYLWRTDRLEWTDGTSQTLWTTPYQINSVQGTYPESRFLAATDKPIIIDPLSREPISDGRTWELSMPGVIHPSRSFVWITSGVVDRFEDMQIAWTDPAKYATPDTTQAAIVYAVGTKSTYPSFTPGAEGLPGPDWKVEYPSNLSKGQYVWTTERLEWTDGTSQTPWTAPYRSAAVDSINFENRYKASTTKPAINVTDREPEGWTKNFPTVSHPNASFVWLSTSTVDSVNDELVTNWTDPVKYATPDTSQISKAYAIGDAINFPTFNSSASGLPGPAWTTEYPTGLVKGQYVWNTERVEWTDGTKQTNWTTPYRSAAVDGISSETRYRASTNTPPLVVSDRNPAGWTISIPSVSHPGGNFIWATNAIIDSVNDELVGVWDSPSKYATPDTTVAGRSYAIGTKTGYPTFTSTAAGLPGPDWSATPPAPVPSDKFVWYSERLQWSDGIKQTNWTTPIRITGEDGTSGKPGTDGKPGAGYYTIVDNAAAANWPSNASAKFKAYTGRDPIKGDALTFVNTAKTQTNSKMYTGSTWGAFDYVVDGDIIINGTIAGDKIVGNTITGNKFVANVEIQAPVIKGGRVEAVTFQGVNVLGTGTITGGTISGTQFTNGSGFSVSPSGALRATGANISGVITATSGTFTGTVRATNSTFTGTVSGSRIEGGSMGIGSNFAVSSSGVLTAKSANITGAITATSGTFTGTVRATNSTFTGTVSASAINTSTFTTGSGKFTVNSAGIMTATGANVTGAITATTLTVQAVNSINMTATGTITGGKITGSRITGGSIYVPNENSPLFRVDTRGNMYCQDAVVNGTITSKPGSQIYGHITAESLELIGSIPPEINNSTLTPSINSAQSTANAAQVSANTAQNTANTANSAANTAQGGVNTINGKMYLDQSKIQIRSSNYQSGSTGWAINQAGSAEFSNTIVRGTVYATSGWFKGTVYAENMEGDVIDILPKYRPPQPTSHLYAGQRKEMFRVTVTKGQSFARKLYIDQVTTVFALSPSSPPCTVRFYYWTPWTGNVTISERRLEGGGATHFTFDSIINVPTNSTGDAEFWIQPLDGNGGQTSCVGLTIKSYLMKQASNLA